MPFAVGNYWIFQAMNYQDGEIEYQATDTMRVLSSITDADGREWFDVGLKDSSGIVYYGNTGRGFEILRDHHQLIVPYPAALGRHTLYYGGEEQGSVELVDQYEIVEVPAGKFTCYHYIYLEGLPGESHAWYVPGVGLVKSHQIFTSEDGHKYDYIRALLEYKVQ